jgi:D-glycero-alpha-D-manno-heptose-7-phosphate kinase
MSIVVSKTPLRISFFGGGTDIPEYYTSEDRSGLVISTTIDKHIYIAANRCVGKHVKVIYSELELADDIEGIKHDRVREALRMMSIRSHIEVCSFSDVPTRGTGLGSSSTFTVGLLNSLYSLKSLPVVTRRMLAEDACSVEITMCRQPIGKQDQYAAAYGGFNAIRFASDGTTVQAIDVDRDILSELQKNLMLYSTGVVRQASPILQAQVDDMKADRGIDKMDGVKRLAEEALLHITRGKTDDFGALLHEAWTIKRSLSGGVSTARIDEMYETARRAGALGGKILGAGGGGYLLLYVPYKHQYAVGTAMQGHEQLYFNLTDEGTRIVRI